MVKHCSFGTGKSDSRYPDKLNGAKFIPFPKPKTNLEKYMRWIALCHRHQDQLNINKITKDTYICTKHFVNNDGPTTDYPDPCDAKSGELKKARHLPLRHHSNLFVENAACKNEPSLSIFVNGYAGYGCTDTPVRTGESGTP
uniref:THAP-type domain-containing protein n=1 Tax=Magallana gigas TaxID=29159 RepID=A0A8W8MAW4_MAGGI